MEEPYLLYVGIDWATEAHEVCVLDTARRILDQRSVRHAAPDLAGLADRLAKLGGGDPGRVAVSIEVPRGAVVELLIERGFHVYGLNPKQLDRFRDRHTMAGAKDDRLDAFVLADSLRTDRHLFRRLSVDDPHVIELREMSRIDSELREETNRLNNRLRELLHRYYPQVLTLCPSANEPWLWDLIELAPTPEIGARLTPAKIRKLLAKHRIRRVDAAGVQAALKTPALQVAPGTVEAASAHVGLLLPRLAMVASQRHAVGKRLEALLEAFPALEADESKRSEHRDVDILLSLPGVGKRVGATMLSEASQPLGERDYHALRAHVGAAPVTRRSGKHLRVVMRHGCNNRLRNACYHWARVAVQVDAHWKASYAALRSRGHSHGRALRTVVDRLLKVLVAMLRERTVYDPTRWLTEPTGDAAAVA